MTFALYICGMWRRLTHINLVHSSRCIDNIPVITFVIIILVVLLVIMYYHHCESSYF